MYIVIGIIFIAISLVMLISPDTVFAITESLKTNSSRELTDTYRLRSRIGGSICLLLGICLMIVQTLPTKEDLILTPSTHKEVQYIQIDDTKIGKNEKVKLALYDSECSYIEVCIAIPKSSNRNQVIENLTMYVDDKEVEKYTVTGHTTLWKQYVILLFEDMEGWNEMRLERDDYVVEFQYTDIKK